MGMKELGNLCLCALVEQTVAVDEVQELRMHVPNKKLIFPRSWLAILDLETMQAIEKQRNWSK